jgi:hypothetical protein
LLTTFLRQLAALHSSDADMVHGVAGFHEDVRKFVCHVVCITYQVPGSGHVS